jgi:hypothetical protein
MRSSSSTRAATNVFLGLLVISAGLILTLGLPVEYLGTVIVYDVALVCVLLLLLAPTDSERRSS